MCKKVGTEINSIYTVPFFAIQLMWRVESIWTIVELDLGLVFAFIIFSAYNLPNSLVMASVTLCLVGAQVKGAPPSVSSHSCMPVP